MSPDDVIHNYVEYVKDWFKNHDLSLTSFEINSLVFWPDEFYSKWNDANPDGVNGKGCFLSFDEYCESIHVDYFETMALDQFLRNVMHDVVFDRDICLYKSEISTKLHCIVKNCKITAQSDSFIPGLTETSSPNENTKAFFALYANFGCGLGGSACDYLYDIIKQHLNFDIVAISDDLKMVLEKSINEHALYPGEELENLDNCLKNIEIDGDLRHVVLLENEMGGSGWVCRTNAPDCEINKLVEKINQNYIDFPNEDISNPDNQYYINISKELENLGYMFDFVSEDWFEFKDYLIEKGNSFVVDPSPIVHDDIDDRNAIASEIINSKQKNEIIKDKVR